jgi:hypothetical protein
VEYTKTQLEELAKGAFTCSPTVEAFYAASNGTFMNEEQYKKASEQKGFKESDYTKITNPNLKVTKSAKAKAESESGDGTDTGASKDKAKDKATKNDTKK